MTEAELRELLGRLADHLGVMIDDLQDTAWPASGGSNLGAAPVGPKSKAPCSVDALNFLITDVGPRVKGWCRNLCEAGGVTLGPVVEQPLNIWVAWLSRHRTRLLAMPWAQDAIEELIDLEDELRKKLNPPDEAQLQVIAAIAQDRKGTANEIAGLLSTFFGKRVDRRKIGYLAATGRVSEYTAPDGSRNFSLVEVRDALEEWSDKRSNNRN